MDMSTTRSTRALRNAVSAVLALAALLTGALVAPAGAQDGTTATATTECFDDGVGWIVVTIDDAAAWTFRFFLDGEEATQVIAPRPLTYAIGGLEDRTYAVTVTAESDEVEPFEILSTEVTVDCAVAPTTTAVPLPTPAPPMTSAPQVADRTAARGLRFTG